MKRSNGRVECPIVKIISAAGDSRHSRSLATADALTIGAALPQLVRSWFTMAAMSASLSVLLKGGIGEV